jgi:hypothetical protein
MKTARRIGVSAGLMAVALVVGFVAGRSTGVAAQQKNRVFELRIATVSSQEKLNVLMDRFRGGELKIWERLGMKGVGFWVPTPDSPKANNTLIYILAHEDRKKADESWEKFGRDPEWLAFNKIPDLGPVTVDRTYMAPVDFSALK